MGRLNKEMGIAPREAGYSRLRFLSSFLRSQGLLHEDAARMLGMSRVGFGHYFIVDDMLLSVAQRVVNLQGYDLAINFVHKGEIIESCIGPEARLAFLDEMRRALHLTKTELASSLNIGYSAVRHWFQNDDIYISRIFQLSEALGLDLDISITPCRKERMSGRVLTTTMVIVDKTQMKNTINAE